MKPAALVVTMGMDAVAPARMPRELQRAGFHVTLASDAPWDDPDLLTAMVALAGAAEDSESRSAAAGGS